MSRLILLIGATGFIGKNLAHHLTTKDKYDVVAVSKSGMPVLDLPGISFQDFLKINPPKDSIIINCAAVRYDASDVSNPADRLLGNVNIISAIYKFCLRKKITEVRQFSSLAVYPADDFDAKDTGGIDINSPPLKGELMYGWSKRISEIYSNLFYEQCGINTITFRLANPYGPYDRLSVESAHVIPTLIIRALRSEGELFVDGNLDATRDFIFVDDICDVVQKSLWVAKKTATYNLGTGKQVSVREVALAIQDILKKPKSVKSSDTLKNPAAIRLCPNEHLMKDFSLMAFTPLRKGLNKTVKWYQEALGYK